MKKVFFAFVSAFLLIGSLSSVSAHSGRTDSSGGHNCNVGSCAGSYHYHSGGYSTPSRSYTPSYTRTTTTYSCDKYGIMAISTGNGYCECSSGYVFQKNIFGDKKCVSRDTYCENKYGYGASYNSLDEVCKCGYGKVFQKKIFEDKLECVSCYTKYGLHAEYNSSTKGCQCEDGYIAKDKVYGDGQECVKIEEEETKTNTTKDPVLDKICKSLYGDLSFWGTASKRCLCFNSSITELVPCVLISDTKASTTNTTKSKNNVMQSTDKSWEKIKRGMSKTEVKNILGYPLKTVKISDKELYFYDQKRKKRITFQNERVTNILKRQ